MENYVYIYIERYRFRYTDKNGNIVKGLHETDGVMDTPMVPMTKYHDEFSWLTRRSCQKSTHLSSLGVIPTTLNTGKLISNSDRRFLTWNLHWGMYVYIYIYIHTYVYGWVWIPRGSWCATQWCWTMGPLPLQNKPP